MALTRRDEVLEKVLGTDEIAVPRYDVEGEDGELLHRNVRLVLKNRIVSHGTPIGKAALDEMLAASGVTGGTAAAYTLEQENFVLANGAPIRFQLHATSGDGATLNVGGSGAKPLVDAMGKAMPGGIPAGTWLTANYSAAAGAYVLAGGESVRALYGERYAVDDAVAHMKDVPGDALPYAEVGEVGGMTYRVNVGTVANPVYELRSAPVTEVESVGVNLLEPTSISGVNVGVVITYAKDKTSVILNGTCTQNAYLDIGRVILGNDDYVISGGFEDCGVYVSGATATNRGGVTPINDVDKNATRRAGVFVLQGKTYNNYHVYPMINKGTTALPYTPYVRNTLPIPESVQALDGYGESNPDDATEYNAIKWLLSGVRIYSHKGNIVNGAWVPLPAPEITDISDILPADNILPIEAGGTITAVNEYGYAVPSTITYQRNVLDNRASTYAIDKLRAAMEPLATRDDVAEQSKVISTTKITGSATQIDIPVPSGYTRYRLTVAGISVNYEESDGYDPATWNLYIKCNAATISARSYKWRISSMNLTAPVIDEHTDGTIGRIPANLRECSASFTLDLFKNGDNWAGVLNGGGSSHSSSSAGFCYANSLSTEITKLTLTCSYGITAGMILLEGLA